MLTDTSNSASGSKFISLHWPHEVPYWTRSLGCTEDELRKAVVAVATRRRRSGSIWLTDGPGFDRRNAADACTARGA